MLGMKLVKSLYQISTCSSILEKRIFSVCDVKLMTKIDTINHI